MGWEIMAPPPAPFPQKANHLPVTGRERAHFLSEPSKSAQIGARYGNLPHPLGFRPTIYI